MRIQGQPIGAGDLLYTADGLPFYVDSFSPGSGEVWGYRTETAHRAGSGPVLTRRAADLSWEAPAPKPDPSDLLATYRVDGMGAHADKWGECMGALFPVCEELYQRVTYETHEHEFSESLYEATRRFLKSEAVFKPSPFLDSEGRAYLDREAGLTPEGDEDPEADGGNFWAREVRDADTADLLAFGRILSRYRDALKRAGEDY